MFNRGIFFVATVPVAIAFGCGYWAALVTKKENANSSQVDSGAEYGGEQAIQSVCGLIRVPKSANISV